MSLNLRQLVPILSDDALVREKLANTTFVGIDFGTSTTVASYTVFDEDELQVKTQAIEIAQMLPYGRIQESQLVPSVVAWHQNTLHITSSLSNLQQDTEQPEQLPDSKN